MSIRNAFAPVALALIVFAGAAALRHAFLSDMIPTVAWDQEPRSLCALGAAFLLCSIQNISLVVGAMVVVATLGERSDQQAVQPLRVPGRN